MAKATPKSSDRTKFAMAVSKQTGLNWYAVYLWTEAVSATTKGYNFLGLSGKSLSGVATTSSGYANVNDAATEASYRINHLAKYAGIKASAGKSQATQFAAIQWVAGVSLNSAENIKASGKVNPSLKDLTVKNPFDTTANLVIALVNSTVKKAGYALGIVGGGLLAIMGLVLIGVDVGISSIANNKGARTIIETAGIGGAILKAGSKESRATRANTKSEQHLTKVRRRTVTKTNKQRTANLKAGKPEVPKTEAHKLTDEEKATKAQIRRSSKRDDIPF